MGFFAIITLYQKLPLFGLPFSIPFRHSENLKPPQNFHNLSKNRQNNAKTTALSYAKGGCYV